MPSTNGTISEVIVGTGVLYVAAISNDGNASGDYVAFPADDGSGAWADPASGWTDVGSVSYTHLTLPTICSV